MRLLPQTVLAYATKAAQFRAWAKDAGIHVKDAAALSVSEWRQVIKDMLMKKRNPIDTSTIARQLRGLIYDKMMAGKATKADLEKADALASQIGLPPPSKATSLLALEKIGRRAFARLDFADSAMDYAEAERELHKIPFMKPPPAPPEEGEEWKHPRLNPADIPHKYILDPSLPLPSGMTRRQAKRVAELREAYQWSMARRFERKKLTDPAIVAEYLVPIMAPLHVEHLMVLPLDSGCKLIEAPLPVTRGDVDGVDAGPRAVLRAVLMAGAVQFILAHNHPAGSNEPSAADRAVTRRIAEGGRAIDCPMRDHLIISAAGTWTSMRVEDPSLF
jgi:DNA repair protein RadC